MELTQRKKQVLQTVVDLYIRTAEPVGSKAVAAMPGMNYSSATIRNELADLTTMGLLEQPHTSAGRIPSPAGYRLYVDELMQGYKLSVDETKDLKNAMELKMQEFDKVLDKVARLVSQATDLPAYTVAARPGAATVKRFEILMAEAGSFILVVMTNGDVVKNKLIKLPLHVTEADLKLLSAVLNASMTGLSAQELTAELLERVTQNAGAAAGLVPVILDFTNEVLRGQQDGSVALRGQVRLLHQPEYQDVEKAQEVLSSLDEETISHLPAVMGGEKTQILVGPENVAQELRDTSVVMTKFDIGEGMQGLIGVVGPTRMDYAKITARLSYFAENLSKMFSPPEPNRKQLPEGSEPEAEGKGRQLRQRQGRHPGQAPAGLRQSGAGAEPAHRRRRLQKGRGDDHGGAGEDFPGPGRRELRRAGRRLRSQPAQRGDAHRRRKPGREHHRAGLPEGLPGGGKGDSFRHGAGCQLAGRFPGFPGFYKFCI